MSNSRSLATLRSTSGPPLHSRMETGKGRQPKRISIGHQYRALDSGTLRCSAHRVYRSPSGIACPINLNNQQLIKPQVDGLTAIENQAPLTDHGKPPSSPLIGFRLCHQTVKSTVAQHKFPVARPVGTASMAAPRRQPIPHRINTALILPKSPPRSHRPRRVTSVPFVKRKGTRASEAMRAGDARGAAGRVSPVHDAPPSQNATNKIPQKCPETALDRYATHVPHIRLCATAEAHRHWCPEVSPRQG